MLDFIVRQAEHYRRTHGVDPNVLYLTRKHYAELQSAAPGLFDDDPMVALGFALSILPDESLAHPRLGHIPHERECCVSTFG